MNITTLLRELESCGASVALDGEALHVTPARVLTDELRQEIRNLKPEIIAALKEVEMRRAVAMVNAGPCSGWTGEQRLALAAALVANGLAVDDLDNESKVRAAHRCGFTTNGYAVDSGEPYMPHAKAA